MLRRVLANLLLRLSLQKRRYFYYDTWDSYDGE
jgi:hypothetical protein